jgi:hypothetical protein
LQSIVCYNEPLTPNLPYFIFFLSLLHHLQSLLKKKPDLESYPEIEKKKNSDLFPTLTIVNFINLSKQFKIYQNIPNLKLRKIWQYNVTVHQSQSGNINLNIITINKLDKKESTMYNTNLTTNFHGNTEFIFRIQFVVAVAIICVRFLAVVVVLCVWRTQKQKKREKCGSKFGNCGFCCLRSKLNVWRYGFVGIWFFVFMNFWVVLWLYFFVIFSKFVDYDFLDFEENKI